MIDLHLHTVFSDGLITPEDLVKRAKEKGMSTIAITDHDGVGGLEEALAAGDQLGVQVICGVEFTTEYLEFYDPVTGAERQAHTHILGYEIDHRNKALLKAAAKMQNRRRERNKKLMSVLQEDGIDISEKDLNRSKNQYVGRPHFALALIKKGYAASVKEAFGSERLLKNRRVNQVKIETEEAMHLIRQAGGLPVVAHPMKIKGFGERGSQDYFTRLEGLLADMHKWGLYGLECYYSDHSQEETDRLLGMASEFGLGVTVGSDSHGPGMDSKPDIGEIPVYPSAEEEKKILRELKDKLTNI